MITCRNHRNTKFVHRLYTYCTHPVDNMVDPAGVDDENRDKRRRKAQL